MAKLIDQFFNCASLLSMLQDNLIETAHIRPDVNDYAQWVRYSNFFQSCCRVAERLRITKTAASVESDVRYDVALIIPHIPNGAVVFPVEVSIEGHKHLLSCIRWLMAKVDGDEAAYKAIEEDFGSVMVNNQPVGGKQLVMLTPSESNDPFN